ncbi:MAG: NAD(P)-binding domain-containing protein [Planctomycetota bacterium]
METTPLTWIAVLLGGFLILVGAWQRRIDRRVTGRLYQEIEDAESRGTAKAIAQHPQIDPLLCIGCATCVRACPESGAIAIVDGVARIVQGSRCIGHGRCEMECPVGALKVGLGDIRGRPDLPILSETLETTVPGIYIAGELGGFALVSNAIRQGARAVETIAARLAEEGREGPADTLDLLIVGFGPAGISASLKATELGLSYLTINQDDLGGTVGKYPRQKLVLTQPVELPLYGQMERDSYYKEELIEMWEGIIEEHQISVRHGVKLTGCAQRDGLLCSETSDGPIVSRKMVLTLGRRGTPRRLGVPGEEAHKVLYSLVDASSYRDRAILVVGGGDSAIEAATGLANQPGNRVTLSYRKAGFFRMKPRNEERLKEYWEGGRMHVVVSSQVRSISSDSVELAIKETIDGRETERVERLQNDHVFVFAGGEPPYPLLKSMGIGFGDDAQKATETGAPVQIAGAA